MNKYAQALIKQYIELEYTGRNAVSIAIPRALSTEDYYTVKDYLEANSFEVFSVETYRSDEFFFLSAEIEEVVYKRS